MGPTNIALVKLMRADKALRRRGTIRVRRQGRRLQERASLS